MSNDKKSDYPAQSTEDNRYKNQDEFDNAPREDRKAEQHINEPATSTAKPDRAFNEISDDNEDD